MRKKIVFLISFLFLGLVIGILSLSVWNYLVGPSKVDTAFVQACGELNGEEFTYKNISSLQGNCYITCQDKSNCVTAGVCEEKHIEQYQNFTKICGEPVVEKSNSPSSSLDSYYRCTDEYRENRNKMGDLSIRSNGTFYISQWGLDNVWACSISTMNSKIRAVPYFIYD